MRQLPHQRIRISDRARRTRAINRILEGLNSGPQHPSRQRVIDLLDLLQEAERCEKVFEEHLRARAKELNLEGSGLERQFQDAGQPGLRYALVIAKANRLLRRYRSAPVLQTACFAIDSRGLSFYWEMDRGDEWEVWENGAVSLILGLIESKEFHRLRKCRNCAKRYFAQTDHQVHCSDDCRKQFASRDSRFKERRRLYMAEHRKRQKMQDKRMAQVAREVLLNKNRRTR
jgi:hypothetical protein